MSATRNAAAVTMTIHSLVLPWAVVFIASAPRMVLKTLKPAYWM